MQVAGRAGAGPSGQVSESRATEGRSGRERLPNLLGKIPNVRLGALPGFLFRGVIPCSSVQKGGLKEADR
jgi:hypothetical protein